MLYCKLERYKQEKVLVFLIGGGNLGVFNFFRRDNEDASKNQVADDNVETESNESLLLTALLKGEKIDKNKALSIPAVSSAVDKLSNLVAMLPIKLYQRVEIDGKRKDV